MNDDFMCMKASLATLVIFESFAMPIFLLFLITGIVRDAGWNGAIFCGAICILVFVWWRSYELEIDGEVLIYRSLLQGRKRVRLADVSRVVSRGLIKSSGIRPPFRLEIYYNVNGVAKEFDINERVFSMADVTRLKDRLGAK